MLLGIAGVMTFGFWKVGKGIREQKYVWHLYPYFDLDLISTASFFSTSILDIQSEPYWQTLAAYLGINVGRATEEMGIMDERTTRKRLIRE